MPETAQIRLVGRGAEIKRLTAELRALTEQALSPTPLITIAGDPGVGKTRLIRETREVLESSPLQWLETSCALHGPGHPWHPMRGLLQQMAGFEPDMVSEERLLRLNSMAERRGISAHALDALRHLLALPTESSDWDDLAPPDRRRRLHGAMTDFVGTFAGEGPLALVVEDLHWIDPETMQWLDEFLSAQESRSALTAHPITVIALHRPVFSHLWPARVRRVDVRLGPLDKRASSRLLRDLFNLGATFPESLIDDIVRHTGGNPFFMEEAMRLLRDRGALQPDGSLQTADVELPTTAAGLVEERLQRFSRSAKQVLQAAAVIGPEIRPELLSHLCEDAADMDESLDVLTRAEMLERRTTVRGTVLAFRHSIIQEVTHSSLMQRQRREIHGKLALHLETLHRDHLEESAELLAHHFGLSNHHSRAAFHLRLAAERAKRLCSHESAEHHLARLAVILNEHSHAVEGADDLRAWVALERGRLARLAGDMERACSLLAEEAVEEEIKFTPLQIQILRSWGETERQRGETETALALHRRAIAGCDAIAASQGGEAVSRERMLSLLALGVTQRVRGELQEALPTLEEAERLARAVRDAGTTASALNNQGICRLAAGEFHRAHAPLREAVDLLRERGDQRNLVGALINLGIVFDRLMELDRALDAYAEALRLAYEIGHRRAILANHINAGQVLQWLDNQAEASRHFLRVIEHCQRRPDAVAEGLAHVNLALSHFQQGALDACRCALGEAERRSTEAKDHTLRIHCALVRAEHDLLSRDADRACQSAAAALRAVGEGDERPWALRLQGRALLATGDSGGQSLLLESLRLARNRRDAREQIQTLTALTEVSRHAGNALAARRHRRRAERLLTRHPIPLLQRNLREAHRQ